MTQIKSPSIHIENAALSFKNTPIFKNINLVIPGGKTTCLLGPSGIGKSSLLKLIANLLPLEWHPKTSIYCENNIPVYKQSSYIAQTDLLLPWFTILENVLLGFRLRNADKVTIKHAKEKAIELLNDVGLHKIKDTFPQQLSGGMKQRVALVRTFIENQPIVLMDEPFSSLDILNRISLQTLTAKLLKKKTVLLVTHDPLEALRLGHEIYIMDQTPAKISLFVSLDSCAPRDPSSSEIAKLHSLLLQKLLSQLDHSL